MQVSVHLSDMLELSESTDERELHVGLIPCMVNNQNGLAFNFSAGMQRLAFAAANKNRPQIVK